MKRTAIALMTAILSLTSINAQPEKNMTHPRTLKLSSEWDKTFPKSNKVFKFRKFNLLISDCKI